MSLPNYLIEAFQKVPENQTINVLMRHSERFPIESDAEVFTAQLTPIGKELAYDFGAWLSDKYKIGRIFSSPINRCVETGVYLAKGSGNGKVVIPDPVLSHPNENGEYNQMGDYLASGEWPDRIIKIAQKMFPDQDSKTLNFYITHDTVLALMAAYWLKMDIRGPEDWPKFLEPMFFWKADDGLKIIFRGKEHRIEMN
jgi:hypothetical protein